ELVVDRLVMGAEVRERLADSVETALRESRRLVLVDIQGTNDTSTDGHRTQLFSEHHACVHCGTSLPDIEPRMFSFNSPYGACPTCDGLGTKLEVDPDFVVPDKTKSIAEGAVQAWSDPVTTRTHRWKRSWAGYYEEILEDVCRRHRV